MFAITIALMVSVCGILIGLGCWWPPREPRLTVTTVQQRLAFESYCRHLGSHWPARTDADRDHERVLSRLHTIAAADTQRAFSRASGRVA